MTYFKHNNNHNNNNDTFKAIVCALMIFICNIYAINDECNDNDCHLVNDDCNINQTCKSKDCKNGVNSTCDELLSDCVLSSNGSFECECKSGYIMEGNHCVPVCNQSCIYGTCIDTNVCQCNFGYIGSDCSLECKCNGHSNCVAINRLNECIECRNNTLGSHCQRCKPLYVGNPVNSGKCVSCYVYCNSHSHICLPQHIYNATQSTADSLLSIDELIATIKEGPLSEAVCVNCEHNTHGGRCDECIPGYFKFTDNIRDGCRRCQCNNHGDMCNPLNGDNCNCQNNTENDRQCNQINSKNALTPCWQLQCSKCKEYFLGIPTNGHQCFRHMFLDKDYCFDPNTQEECHRKPNPLLYGRTVFFAVQPRYMNVDIRIVVDVTKGGLDFYLSVKEDAFVVDVDKITGVHYVWLDKKYSSNIINYNDDDLYEFFLKKQFYYNDSTNEIYAHISNFSSQTAAHLTQPQLKLRHHYASDLIFYITITDPNELLVIRNLQNRLIITIPQEVHDLRSTRFYMILRGDGDDTSGDTHGNIFFRQDQSRIDLFVFFSVFFSCFFLFLATCVVVWKIKQAFDLRRARRLHAAEMKHMASRPFAIVYVYIDPFDCDDYEFALSSPTHHIHGNTKKGRGFRFKGSHSSLKDSPKSQIYPDVADKYLIRPVAIEPTYDELCAVVTTLIQLPGGITAPIRMCLASTLVAVRGSHHILNFYQHCNVSVGSGVWRSAMSRRTHFAF